MIFFVESINDIARIAMSTKAPFIIHSINLNEKKFKHWYSISLHARKSVDIFQWRTDKELLGTYLLIKLDDEGETITSGFKIERNFRAIPIINVLESAEVSAKEK